jgi:hypothetical protein
MTNEKLTAIRTASPYVSPLADTDLLYLVQDVGAVPDERGITGLELRTALGAWDGWILARQTWTYASATTITVPAGAASIYSVGDKIKLTQTTVKYFYIVAVADTLLTVTGGATYTVASAAITLNYYSKASSPVGFPQWFAYTPTGVSATNATLYGRFSLTRGLCAVTMRVTFAGAIVFTTMPTLPITASASSNFTSALYCPSGVAGYYDAAPTQVVHSIYPSVIQSATTVSIKRAADGVDMSADIPITWANGDAFAAKFEYEI